MSLTDLKVVHNEEQCDIADVPIVSIEDFREAILQTVEEGAWIASLSAFKCKDDTLQGIAVLAHSQSGKLFLISTIFPDSYPSISPDCPQAQLFERELAEQWGIMPENHPWFKPVRFHKAYDKRKDCWDRASSDPILPGVADNFRMEGVELHEVAVGPVHAGIIEPGHFRFQCKGEHVYHLEISLGYQHRGIERSLIGGPTNRTIHLIETLAGDTTIGHTIAYCQNLEALSNTNIPARGIALRAVSLELERLANHAGDLGALAGDVGFLPTASYCGRLRGEFLNLSALLCGNRFGRSMIVPGGVRFDVDASQIQSFSDRLDKAMDDLTSAVNLLWESPSVMDRFEGTGGLSAENAIELGLVGPVARACGLEMDVRSDFPTGTFRFTQIFPATWHTGDVFARAIVRWIEIQRSASFLKEQIKLLPQSLIRTSIGDLEPNKVVVSLVEGWRGAVCHVAVTDDAGKFAHYKVVDPSFHNWFGLAYAMRDQQISDFPLCNKSFNLSYCGHDL